MSARLEREGIFKARPLSWMVQTFDSGAVGINMEFVVLSQLDGDEWVSWAEAEEHRVYGTFFVVKKDGTVNARTVESLYDALGWEGSMAAIAGPVPECVVQIVVKAEEYKGQTKYKVAFINPEGYEPGPQGAAPEEVKRLDARFGSLLRAAAAGAKKNAPKPPAAKAAPAPKAAPASTAVLNPISGEPEGEGDDALPDRARIVAELLEESIRGKVKSAAATMGVTLTKASDLDALSTEALVRLRDVVFDANIPF